MNDLKRLALSFTLLCVFALSVLAQSPTCIPGQTDIMPCSSQSVNDDSTDAGETSTPPASETEKVDITDIAETVLWSLLLF